MEATDSSDLQNYTASDTAAFIFGEISEDGDSRFVLCTKLQKTAIFIKYALLIIKISYIPPIYKATYEEYNLLGCDAM
jgi:hypothetical protein